MPSTSSIRHGTWTKVEHDRFLSAIRVYPDGPWKAIAQSVRTRSVRQVQSHAQKYKEKVGRRLRGLLKTRRNCVRLEHRVDPVSIAAHPRGHPTITTVTTTAAHSSCQWADLPSPSIEEALDFFIATFLDDGATNGQQEPMLRATSATFNAQDKDDDDALLGPVPFGVDALPELCIITDADFEFMCT